MTDAFDESATRHWRDAGLLQKEGRYANANQLVGFAAECAIKFALCQLPGFNQDGALAHHYRSHINQLWDKIHVQGLQQRFPGLMAVLKMKNPFHDWSVDHRYAREGTVTEEASQRHHNMAKRLLSSVGINGARTGS